MEFKKFSIPFVVAVATTLLPTDTISPENRQTDAERKYLDETLELLRAENKSRLCPITANSLERLHIRTTVEGLRIGTERRVYDVLEVEIAEGCARKRKFHLHSNGDEKYPTGICIDFDGDPKTTDIDVDECDPK